MQKTHTRTGHTLRCMAIYLYGNGYMNCSSSLVLLFKVDANNEDNFDDATENECD